MESLPNELLIECFQYLNANELFQSFNRLNHRLNQLIREIRLCVDVSKTNFEEINKNQIYSLTLSNRNQCQIDFYLSANYSQLQYLTLIEVKKYNLPKIKSILPILTQLYCFRLIDSLHLNEQILSIVPIRQLRLLTIDKLFSKVRIFYDISSIVSLTLSSCKINELIRIFHLAVNLKYIQINRLAHVWYMLIEKIQDSRQAIHLNELVIKDYLSNFENLSIILEKTPHLRYLTISSHVFELINAQQWENLLNSSTPYLHRFQFSFEHRCIPDREELVKKINEFQSDFWLKKHQWPVNYIFTDDWTWIYTLPCLEQNFVLRKESNVIISNQAKLESIRHLSMNLDAIVDQTNFSFPNIETLTIKDHRDGRYLIETDFRFIQNFVHLSNVKHLNYKCNFSSTRFLMLVDLIKQLPNLSSIVIDREIMRSFVENHELMIYLNKKIRKLELYNNVSSNDIEKFSNLEQLTCLCDDQQWLETIFERLVYLSRINFKFGKVISQWPRSWFQEQENNFHIKLFHDVEQRDNYEYSIWIIREFD